MLYPAMNYRVNLQQVNWTSLIKTELTGKKAPRWLQKTDILFLARGNNNYATYLDEVNEQTLCSPHFFQIHVKDENIILPEYLAWQINQKPVQNYLCSVGEGTVVRNIRRAVLESIPITVPTIKDQLLTIKVSKIENQLHEFFVQQIENNQSIMAGIAQQQVTKNI